MMSKQNDETIATYDITAQQYIESDMQRSHWGYFNNWIDEVFHDVPKDAKILEIGSARGRDAAYLKDKGYSVRLSDVSDGFLAYLREQGFDPIRLDIITDVPEGKWDVVYASAVFLHFTQEDLRRALANIHRALAARGKLIFSMIEGEGEIVKDERLGQPRYFRYYAHDEISDELTRAGFLIEDYRSAEYLGRIWMYIVATRQ